VQRFPFGTLAPLVLALAGGGCTADPAAEAKTGPQTGTKAPAPEEKTGLPVGTKAPAFTLKDQHGKERPLDEFLKKGKVAVVFYRSAAW
jgi:cytochrome oxidase Cu insertion factor (SCO1/SenC/PrrC family)